MEEETNKEEKHKLYEEIILIWKDLQRIENKMKKDFSLDDL
jgi:hypothetical protein